MCGTKSAEPYSAIHFATIYIICGTKTQSWLNTLDGLFGRKKNPSCTCFTTEGHM